MKIAVGGNTEIDLTAPHGTTTTRSNSNNEAQASQFIKTKYQENLLAELIQTYAVSDFCLIGKN